MVATILLLVGTVVGAEAPAAKKELAKLEGTWRTVGGEDNGHAITPEDVKAFNDVYVFKGNTLAFSRRGRLFGEFKVSLDPSKTPKEMDLVITTKNDYEGKTCPAIYSLDGDKLKICTARRFLPTSADERPNVFSTQEQKTPKRQGLMLLILQRQK